jgi:hypothetical protein
MKHYKTVQVPAKESKVLYKTTCDLCGGEITSACYDAEEVEIRHRTGSNYPEGGSGEEVEVDMCGTCFDSKLVPWLREQGANPEPEEWDW